MRKANDWSFKNDPAMVSAASAPRLGEAFGSSCIDGRRCTGVRHNLVFQAMQKLGFLGVAAPGPLNQAKQIFPHALARLLEGHGDLLGLVTL